MNAKNKLFLKYILTVLILSFTIQCVSTVDDSNEEATVEETDSVVEIPYSSPTPSGNYYLAENFDDVDKFKRKWTVSQAKKEGIDEELAKYDGVWDVEEPQKDGLKSDLGLVLKSKAKHAAIAAKLDKPFHFIDKPLVVQYEVNFQEGQECGGAYLKLLSQSKESTDLRQFYDKTPYTIMFGPDKCGNDVKLHFIFRHKNPKNGTFQEKHCRKPKDRLNEPFEDRKPHLYTLIIKPDNSFEIRIDHKVVNKGSLLEDFTPPVNPDPEIDDPNDVKPSNWDEREKIPDPDAKKPDDWDENVPAKIPDPAAEKPYDWLEDEPPMIPDRDAEKPEDWDSDMDGEWEPPLVENPACKVFSGCGPWEPPMIDNPAYKGKWVPPMIDNPNYQGKWKPRRIPNPHYFVDDTPYRMTPISAVGFELWSMSAFIFFDNILITDSISVAEDYASKSFDLKRRKIDQDSESIFTRILKYSNERPYLYAVYIVAIGLPIALLFVFCCSDGKKESSDAKKEADAKKTDAYTPDDIPVPAKSKSQLDIPEDNNEDDGGEENAEDDDVGDVEEDEADDGDISQEEDEVQKTETGQGDASSSLRTRKPLKE
ncbi:UNVERIFIED_CONTAM: hypothetical protein PYX00_005592 [Menopon gallinae]|uniref:Calnexin n=1 Tax=Menopon gallinae TaxID=328185 RepID=A0AAW2HSS6_9NEOP